MRRWLVRALVMVLVGVAGVGLAAQPAAANGGFVRSDPTPGSTVTTPLTEVDLYFSQRPASNAYFAVTSPTGIRIDKLWRLGPAVPLETPVWEWFYDGSSYQPRSYSTAYEVLIPIAYWPEAGDYTVSYVSVASDDELIQGSFTLTYAGDLASAAPADYKPQGTTPDPNLVTVGRSDQPSAPPAQGEAGPRTPQAEKTSNSILLWLVLPLVVAAVVAGIFFFRIVRGPTRPAAPSLSPAERRLARQRVAPRAPDDDAPLPPAPPPATPPPAAPSSSAPTPPAPPPVETDAS